MKRILSFLLAFGFLVTFIDGYGVQANEPIEELPVLEVYGPTQEESPSSEELYGPVYLSPEEVEALSNPEDTISNSDFRVDVCDDSNCEVFGTYVSDQDLYDLSIDTIEVGQKKSFSIEFYLKQFNQLELNLSFSGPGIVTFHKNESSYLVDSPLDQSFLFRNDGFELPQYELEDGSRSYLVSANTHVLKLNSIISNQFTLGFDFIPYDETSHEALSLATIDNHFLWGKETGVLNSPTDVQFYEVDTSSGSGTLFLYAPFQTPFSVDILDSSFQPIEFRIFPQERDYRAYWVSKPQFLSVFLEENEQYYIALRTEKAVASYTLISHFMPSSAEVEDLHVDYIGIGSPTKLPLNKEIIGEVGGVEDGDLYQFVVNEPSVIKFRFDNAPMLNTFLFDEETNLIAEGKHIPVSIVSSLSFAYADYEYDASGFSSAFWIDTPGTYRLMVYPTLISQSRAAIDMVQEAIDGVKKYADMVSFGDTVGFHIRNYLSATSDSTKKANVDALKDLFRKKSIGSLVKQMGIPSLRVSSSDAVNMLMDVVGEHRGSYLLTYEEVDTYQFENALDIDFYAEDREWYVPYVYYLISNYIVQSTEYSSEGNFEPSENLSLGDLLLWVDRSISYFRSVPYRNDCLSDGSPHVGLSVDSPYCPALSHLMDLGVVHIDTDDSLDLYQDVPRGIAVSILSRAFDFSLEKKNCAEHMAFTDIEYHPQCDLITQLHFNGFLAGYDDGTFQPDNFINRAEFSKLLAYMYDHALSNYENSSTDLSSLDCQMGDGPVLDAENCLAVLENAAVSLLFNQDGLFSPNYVAGVSESSSEESSQDEHQEEGETNIESTYSETYPEPPSYSTTGAQQISGASTSVNASQDLFVFTANRLGSHIIYSEGNVDIIKAWLFDPLHQDTRILDYDAEQSAVGQNFRVGGTLDSGTQYYVLVEYADNASGNYRIKVIEPENTFDWGNNDDHTNRIPGDTSQIAYPWYDSRMPTPLTIGQSMNGNIETAQDIDIFSFRIPAEPRFTSYVLEIDSDVPVVVSQGCYGLTSRFAAPEDEPVTSYREEFIKERQDTTGMSNFFSDICLSVRGDWANTGSYTVKFSRAFSELGADDFGNTEVQASHLEFPEGWFTGLISDATDVDMLSFVAPETGWGQVLARPMHAGHMTVIVRDSAGAEVLRHDRAVRTTPDAELSFEMMAGEEYLIELSALTQTDYVFSFAEGLGSEVNTRLTHIEDLAGNIQDMTAIPLGYEHIGDSGVGWFRFTLDAAAAYDFSLANADISWNFIRPDGSYIAFGTGNAVVDLPAGENFLSIDQWFSNAELRMERSNQLPLLEMTMTPLQDLYVGTPLTFDASGSTDPDGVIRDVEWTINGVLDEDTGLIMNKIFDQEGAHSIALLLRDDRGGEAVETLDFVVEARPDGDGIPELATPVTFSSYNQNGYGLMYNASVGVQVLDFVDDVDYFLIIPPSNGSYEIKSWANNNFDVKASLLDADDQLIQEDDNGGYNNGFSLISVLEAGKRYYVRVLASDEMTTGTYGMNFQRLMDDHGSSPYQATPLFLGTSLPSKMCAYGYGSCSYGGDVDYFRFTPELTAEYIIGTSGSVPLKAELIDDISQYNQSYVNGAGSGNNAFFRRTLQAGQTYYLGLQGKQYESKGSYEVFVMQEKDDHPDISAAATALAPNTVINAQIDAVDDVDWFGVSQPGPGSYQLMLTGVVSAELQQQGSTQSVSVGQLMDVDPSLGSIQIRVSASAVGSYSIELKKQNLDDHANDGAGATVINRYQYVSGDIGAVGDVDVFEYVHNGYSCQYLTVESYGSTNVMMTYYGYVSSLSTIPWPYYAYWTAQFFDWDSGSGGNFRKQIYACPGNHMYVKVSHQQNQTGAYQIRMY